MNGEKEKIFRRIREALKMTAPHPGHHGGPPEPQIPRLAATENLSPEGLPAISRGRQPPDPAIPRTRPGGAAESPSPGAHSEDPQKNIVHWLPRVGTDFDAQADLFGRNSAQLKSAFHLLENEAAAAQKLGEIARAEGWRRVAAHGDGARGPATRALVSELGLPCLWTDAGYDVREMERCEAGVTECDALVAQTGSVLVTARSAGGRALSVLPPHHVVLARRDQLVADLPAAFALLERKYGGNYPSFISFITGPSRTGDIERILVLGAHGPKKLTILCW